MKLRSTLFSFLIFLIFSCGEKEKPADSIGKVSITGIELVENSTPSGRTLASFTWRHVFSENFQLTFKESTTGESSSLTLDPNDFRSPYTIDLPFGNYQITGTSSSESSSSTLPIRVSAQITVDSATETLLLKAESDFGLVTFSKSSLAAAPKLIEPQSMTFASSADFYYTYLAGNSLLRTSVTLENGKSFRIVRSIPPFSHQQIQISSQVATVPDSFLPVDFKVTTERILLGESGYPASLSTYEITSLAEALGETSGLQWISGRLFSINDGGNTAEIQELNPKTGALIRTVSVSNVPNVDWEDLAASTTHLFIGDFGNNVGTRKDLKILKIPIASVLNQSQVSAEILQFSYPDQSDFSGSNPNHNFDCEALIFKDNQLHLFSKNLGDGRSKHYTLSPSSEEQVAVLQGSFDAKGLITGADVSLDGKNVVLLGYENQGISSRVFLWTIADVSASILSGSRNQFFLGSPAGLGQTEGISIDSQMELTISGERISFSGLTVPPRMYRVDLAGIFRP